MKRFLLLTLSIPLLSIAVHAQRCDPTLLKHVYNPGRLIVIKKCIAVTGTIVDATKGKRRDGVKHEPDGDTHGWLKPDAKFKNLVNAGNKKSEGGNLVFEIVCIFVPPSQKTAKAACRGFKSKLIIPPVGSHVRIVGQYVQEKNHGKWMEIHPVTSITGIP